MRREGHAGGGHAAGSNQEGNVALCERERWRARSPVGSGLLRKINGGVGGEDAGQQRLARRDQVGGAGLVERAGHRRTDAGTGAAAGDVARLGILVIGRSVRGSAGRGAVGSGAIVNVIGGCQANRRGAAAEADTRAA